MKISLSSALVMALAGATATDVNATNPNIEPKGICGVDRHVWSRTWTITLTKVWDDHRGICDKLWANLAGRKYLLYPRVFSFNLLNRHPSSVALCFKALVSFRTTR